MGALEAILTTHGVTVEQFEAGIMREYLQRIFWRQFSGTSEGSIIQMKDDLTKTAGDAITVNLRSRLIGGRVTGSNKAKGNEGRMEFYAQRITVDNDRVVGRMDNVPMVQQRVKFSVIQSLRDGIVEDRQLLTDERITNALSDTSNRVRGRYLYGAADSNWNATHTTALQNIDNTDDKLTTDIGAIAKRKAKIPRNATAKIRPMRIQPNPNDFQEWFVFVNHTNSIRDLVNEDARWRQPMLLVPPTSNPRNPIFTGSSFKGAYDGVLYHEFEGIELIQSTVQVGHSLFLGAQAAAFVWAQFGKFAEESEDFGHDFALEHHEINNVAKLVFDRNSVNSSIANEDNGIVHVFVAAVND